MRLNQYVDALIDGLYTAGTTLLGYMVAAGGPVMPSKAATLAASLTGLVGFANQLRGLRKLPPMKARQFTSFYVVAGAVLLAGCAPSMPLNPSDMTAEQIKAAVADKSYSMGCAHTETPYKIGTIFLNFDKGVLPAGTSGTVKINADCSVEWTVVPYPKPGQ